MPTPLENELGLGPVMHRGRRWFRDLLARVGGDAIAMEPHALDPLTVNYAAWDEVRRSAREWPHYKEAPNSLEILVSPEDWEDYWGIDTARKEQGIASYVRSCAAERGYWMAGEPQVLVMADDMLDIGEVEVSSQFAEAANGEDVAPLSYSLAQRAEWFEDVAPVPEQEPEPEPELAVPEVRRRAPKPGAAPENKTTARPASKPGARKGTKPGAKAGGKAGQKAGRKRAASAAKQAPVDPPTIRMIDPASSPEAILTDDDGFRLKVRSGDCIGAVREGEEVPEEVNIRLDAEGFPYVDVKQCELRIIDGRWTVTNHSYHGTKLVTSDGRRFMLGEPEPYTIMEGDMLFLGPERPLRFSLL